MRAVALVVCASSLALRFMPGTNDPHLAALLEPIRQKHHLPALGGAIVTSQGLQGLAVTGVRKDGSAVAAGRRAASALILSQHPKK